MTGSTAALISSGAYLDVYSCSSGEFQIRQNLPEASLAVVPMSRPIGKQPGQLDMPGPQPEVVCHAFKRINWNWKGGEGAFQLCGMRDDCLRAVDGSTEYLSPEQLLRHSEHKGLRNLILTEGERRDMGSRVSRASAYVCTLQLSTDDSCAAGVRLLST